MAGVDAEEHFLFIKETQGSVSKHTMPGTSRLSIHVCTVTERRRILQGQEPVIVKLFK